MLSKKIKSNLFRTFFYSVPTTSFICVHQGHMFVLLHDLRAPINEYELSLDVLGGNKRFFRKVYVVYTQYKKYILTKFL